MQTNQMMTPNLSVCVSAVPNNRYFISLIRDEYVDLGPYRVLRSGVTQLLLSVLFDETAFGGSKHDYWKE